jgi:hypothetical protein
VDLGRPRHQIIAIIAVSFLIAFKERSNTGTLLPWDFSSLHGKRSASSRMWRTQEAPAYSRRARRRSVPKQQTAGRSGGVLLARFQQGCALADSSEQTQRRNLAKDTLLDCSFLYLLCFSGILSFG